MHSPLDPRSPPGGCCVFLRRPSYHSRVGYRALSPAGFEEGKEDDYAAVKVVVGKERRVFFVEPFVLEEDPMRVLMEMAVGEGRGDGKGAPRRRRRQERKGDIFVDIDHILFEHMLWLVYNDRSSASSSLFQLNFKEIIEFYSQEN